MFPKQEFPNDRRILKYWQNILESLNPAERRKKENRIETTAIA